MRKRIKKELIGEIVVDELAFSENIGSKNARKVSDRAVQIHTEIWYDKHYLNRVQFGGDDGLKRDGIEESTIQELVSHSISHLINYAVKIKGFSFVNTTNPKGHNVRIVLQRQTEFGLLNVVVGFYQQHTNRYEVTVFTAMVASDFRISDGQFALEIDNDSSNLLKMENRKLRQLESHP